MSDDIHDKEQELHLNNETFKTSEYVSDTNKETVSKFCDKCFAQGLSNARVSKYISNSPKAFKMKIRKYTLTSDLYPQGTTVDIYAHLNIEDLRQIAEKANL